MIESCALLGLLSLTQWHVFEAIYTCLVCNTLFTLVSKQLNRHNHSYSFSQISQKWGSLRLTPIKKGVVYIYTTIQTPHKEVLTVSLMSTSMPAARNLCTTSRSPCSQAWNSCSGSWWKQHKETIMQLMEKETQTCGIWILNMTWYSKVVLKKIKYFLSLKIKLLVDDQNLQYSTSGNYERQINHRSYTRTL